MKQLNSQELTSNNLPWKICFRFLVAIVSLMAIAGCSKANQLEIKKNVADYKPVTQKNIPVSFPDSFEIAQNIDKKPDLTNSEDISLTSPTRILEGTTFLKLTPTDEQNAVGNPIYKLQLLVGGEVFKSYDTVTGRYNTQVEDRHVSGTEAPLPDGEYQVFNNIVPGTHPEVGGRFLPIEPKFDTGRFALGFHFDPSYEKQDGEDGTAGCIAFINKEQFDNFLADLKLHNFQSLIVKIE